MTETEKLLLSALERLQSDYGMQQKAWQSSYANLQQMFVTTSAALTRSDQACQHLSGQVESLRQQVMSLTEAVSRLTRR